MTINLPLEFTFEVPDPTSLPDPEKQEEMRGLIERLERAQAEDEDLTPALADASHLADVVELLEGLVQVHRRIRACQSAAPDEPEEREI